MLKEAIYHRSESSWAYPVTGEQLRVILRTARCVEMQCNVIARERYDIEYKEFVTPMEAIGSDDLFTYWQAEIGFLTRRIMYYFQLQSADGERLWYGERGTSVEPKWAGWFQFPMISKGDLFVVPEWAKGAVAYQIFPDRFANGDPSNDPPHVCSWEINPPRDLVAYPYTSFGGDLKGIVSRLPYLAKLGIDLVYLTPIFDSPSAHKYDIRDYLKIDPQFGEVEDLRVLVRKAHKLGIKVILDGVFNHCGYEFAPFQDVVAHGPKSRYWDWFHVHDYPIVTDPVPNYEAWAFTPLVPRLNTSNPEVAEYFTNVGLYWLREVGIDGWRLDTANEADPEFWRMFRRAIKAEFPQALLLGEVWHDANRWLEGDQFDSVMNYLFREAVLGFFATGTINAPEFDAQVTRMLVMYRQQAQEINLNLLGSHDTGRFLGFCDNRKESLKLAIAFQMTFLGMPMIYYGDEIGMTSGGGLEDGRAPMIWDQEAQDLELLDYVSKLVHLRKQYTVLRTGTFRSILVDGTNNIYAFSRQLEQETIVIVLNNSSNAVHISLPWPSNTKQSIMDGLVFQELLTETQFLTGPNVLDMDLKPFGVQIWTTGS